STALMPRAVSVGKAAPSRPLLHGALGLLVVLALTFLAAFVVGSWFFASTARARRDRELARRMLARPVADADLPARPDTGAEVRLGRPFDQALTALSERVGTEEFQWAVLAVNVQREVGGNLAEILDTLADTVREREQVRRQVSVLSAEGRMSVKILILMPFLI